MGMIKPEVGQFVRICIELKGSKDLTESKYEDWKKALKKLANEFGATYKTGELINIPPAQHRKPGKKRV